MPALQVSKTNLNEILKESGRGNTGGRRARLLASGMVVAELALTIVLLAGAGLMIRSFMNLYSMDIGVDTGRMLTMRLTLAEKKYPTPEQRRLFYEALLPRLSAIPGAAAASITNAPPASGAGSRALEIEGRPEADPKKVPQVTTLLVSATYFDTLGVTMRQGRPLRDADGNPGSEAVVVNARFASQFFPGEDVVGKRIRLKPGGRGPDAQQPKPWMTIVGVAPTIRQRNVQDVDPDAVAYLSYRLEPPQGTAILIRGLGDPGSLTAAVRMALGAQPRQVSWLILRQGLVQLAIGLTLGTAGALAAAPVLRTLLVQIKPSDPATLAGIGIVFAAVTICACLIPARRATRLDPLAALRVE